MKMMIYCLPLILCGCLVATFGYGAKVNGIDRLISVNGEEEEENGLHYEPLGCYNDVSGDRALPLRINNFRDTIDWKDMNKTIVKCAECANKLGYHIFGVQFYGECYTGNHADTTYDKHGPSENCWNGVGAQLANFVYEIVVPKIKPEEQ